MSRNNLIYLIGAMGVLAVVALVGLPYSNFGDTAHADYVGEDISTVGGSVGIGFDITNDTLTVFIDGEVWCVLNNVSSIDPASSPIPFGRCQLVYEGVNAQGEDLWRVEVYTTTQRLVLVDDKTVLHIPSVGEPFFTRDN